MITLAVAAILTTVAVPSLRTFILNVRRDSAVDSLVASLHYTRNQALNLDQNTSLCAGNSGTACSGGLWLDGWQVVTQPAGSTSVLLITHKLQPSATSPKITIASGTTSFTFDGRGLAPSITGTPALMLICDGRGSAYARAVEINLAGYIQSSTAPGHAPDNTPLVCP